MNRPLLPLIAAFAAALFAIDASASGILVARFGGEHGHPTTDNPTAMYYNPAGLALGFGTRLYIDGNFAWRSFTFNRDPDGLDNPQPEGYEGAFTPNSAAGVAANSGEATLFNVLASPFFGVVSDFGVEGLGVGLSFYVPFGGQSTWDEGKADADFPGALDGPQRWWVIEGTIRSLYVTGAAAYRVPKLNLSFGAGVNMVVSEINTIRARNADGTDNIRSGALLKEGRTQVDVSSTDFSISGGIIWEPAKDWWVGVSYQGQPGFGQNTLEGDAIIISGAGAVAEGKTKIEIFQTLPDVVRAGVRWRPTPKDEIRLFGAYVRWSVFDEQCVLNAETEGRSCETGTGSLGIIPRNWEDAFDVRAGYSRWLTDTVEVYGGAGFDGSAVPDETLEPSLFDAPKATLSVGARFELLDKDLAVAAAYTQVLYFPPDIAPRDRTAMVGTDPATSLAGTGVEERQRNPDAAGTYEHSVGVLNINVEYRF